MIIKQIMFIFLTVFFSFVAHAQTGLDSISPLTEKYKVIISGFADLYYVYDFSKPNSVARQPFLYNYNRHHEFQLNYSYLKIQLEHDYYKANLAFHAGTYVQDNYAGEPDILKNIYEANIGFALNKTKNLWFDLGIFSSHIGFESAVSLDNWTLSRSLLAENSPYYLSGVKLNYKANSKWEMSAIICNGWQKLVRIQENSLLSAGTQLRYTPHENITLNWSTFIGTDDPDSTRRMRYFNNFYGIFQVSKRLGFIAGFDIGIQQKHKLSNQFYSWFSPVVMAQVTLPYGLKSAIRAEYYQDRNGVIITTSNTGGFQTFGFSGNFDYMFKEALLFRLEGRILNSLTSTFPSSDNPSKNNFMLALSLSGRFSSFVK